MGLATTAPENSSAEAHREVYVPEDFVPGDGECAVLSVLALREGEDWVLASGSLLTVDPDVAIGSWKSWEDRQAAGWPQSAPVGFDLGPCSSSTRSPACDWPAKSSTPPTGGRRSRRSAPASTAARRFVSWCGPTVGPQRCSSGAAARLTPTRRSTAPAVRSSASLAPSTRPVGPTSSTTGSCGSRRMRRRAASSARCTAIGA